jgi:hypothetical protein
MQGPLLRCSTYRGAGQGRPAEPCLGAARNLVQKIAVHAAQRRAQRRFGVGSCSSWAHALRALGPLCRQRSCLRVHCRRHRRWWRRGRWRRENRGSFTGALCCSVSLYSVHGDGSSHRCDALREEVVKVEWDSGAASVGPCVAGLGSANRLTYVCTSRRYYQHYSRTAQCRKVRASVSQERPLCE